MSNRFSRLLSTIVATTSLFTISLMSVSTIANAASQFSDGEGHASPTIEINFDALDNNNSKSEPYYSSNSPFEIKPAVKKHKKHKKSVAVKSVAVKKAVVAEDKSIATEDKAVAITDKNEVKPKNSKGSNKENVEKAIERLNTPAVVSNQKTEDSAKTIQAPAATPEPKKIVKEPAKEAVLTPPPALIIPDAPVVPAPKETPKENAKEPAKEVVLTPPPALVIPDAPVVPAPKETPKENAKEPAKEAVLTPPAEDSLVGTVIKGSNKPAEKEAPLPVPVVKATDAKKTDTLPVPSNPTSEFANALNEPVNPAVSSKETANGDVAKGEAVKTDVTATDKLKMHVDSEQNKAVMTIKFLTTETNLPLSVEDDLKKLINTVKSSNGRITLIGYASESGDQTTTARRVSLSRVLAVRTFMIDKGINKMNINVQAEGSRSAGGIPDRVDIFINNSK